MLQTVLDKIYSNDVYLNYLRYNPRWYVTLNENPASINDFEKDTLEDILAYYIRKDETIDAKKVINRCFFPKDNNTKQYIGHMYYKNNIVKLMIEVAIATRCKATNRSIETIEFSKINTIEL